MVKEAKELLRLKQLARVLKTAILEKYEKDVTGFYCTRDTHSYVDEPAVARAMYSIERVEQATRSDLNITRFRVRGMQDILRDLEIL